MRTGLIVVWLLAASLFAGEAIEPVWEPVSEHDGILVHRWSPPGSPLFAFKGETVISQPMARVASVLIDAPRRKEWIPNLIESRVVREINPDERIEYTAIRTPPFTKDRDFVLHGRAEWKPAEKELVLHFTSVEDPALPETDHVRGQVIDSAYRLKYLNERETWVEYRVHVDPKGSIAKWLVNLVQKNMPRYTLEAIRRQAAKPDIVDHPRVAALFKRS